MKKVRNAEREAAVIHGIYAKTLALLKKLNAISSFSGDEERAADIIEGFLQDHYVFTFRKHNNVFCYNLHFDHGKPTILLIAHHDTVKSTAASSRDPFSAGIDKGKLYGLGSNDAGGPLCALIAAFLYFFKRRDLPFNICLAITADEENLGEKGLNSILKQLLPISFAIVGGPQISA